MPFRMFSNQGIPTSTWPSWPIYELGAHSQDVEPAELLGIMIPDWPIRSQGILTDPVQGLYAICPISWGRPMPVCGSIHHHLITGIAKDVDESPVSGATILLFRSSDNVYMGTATSGSDGRYNFGVPDDSVEYYVVAYKSGSPFITGLTARAITGS